MGSVAHDRREVHWGWPYPVLSGHDNGFPKGLESTELDSKDKLGVILAAFLD